MTVDLQPLAETQRALIGQLDRERSGPLMAAMDACNARFGRGSVVPARAGLERARSTWSTKFEMRDHSVAPATIIIIYGREYS